MRLKLATSSVRATASKTMTKRNSRIKTTTTVLLRGSTVALVAWLVTTWIGG